MANQHLHVLNHKELIITSILCESYATKIRPTYEYNAYIRNLKSVLAVLLCVYTHTSELKPHSVMILCYSDNYCS